MATITLRPTSASGTSWSNTAYVYDGSTTTAGTVSITSSTYSSRTLTCNFDTSVIPSGSTINSATLTIIAKQSSSTSTRRVTVRCAVNGGTTYAINTQLTSTSNTTLTADITSSMSSLSTIVVTGYMTASQTQTFSVYELYITVDYTEPITYTVTFKDWNGTILGTVTVNEGANATAPPNPTREGYEFIGWDKTFINVTSNLEVIAQYKKINISINVNKGITTLSKAYIGDKEIIAIYIGDIKIFSKGE